MLNLIASQETVITTFSVIKFFLFVEIFRQKYNLFC